MNLGSVHHIKVSKLMPDKVRYHFEYDRAKLVHWDLHTNLLTFDIYTNRFALRANASITLPYIDIEYSKVN